MYIRFCIAMQALHCLMFTEAKQLQCPDHSQWSLRFRAFCKNSTARYFCLYDKNNQRYKEVCSNEEPYHKPGFKFIISGNLNGEPCNHNRFQPFKFSTDGYSECVFLKSPCNDNGQILHNDGTTKTDITCRCDYTRGYAYINKPNNTCYCNPRYEDCSCYKKLCGGNEVLTADYVCINQAQWYKDITCPNIKKRRRNDNSTICDIKLKQTVVLAAFFGPSEFYELKHTNQFLVIIFMLSMFAVLSMVALVKVCHKFCLRIVEAVVEEKMKDMININKQDVHRQHIDDLIKDDEKFIERDCCVLVVAVDGNGKSSIVRHMTLKLKKQEHCEFIPIVRSPFTIFEFLNKNQKQMFVVGDLCGEVDINTQFVDE